MAVQRYNFAGWEPKALKSLVPNGDFKVQCTGCRWKGGDGGAQRYLQLDLMILDPDYAGLTLLGQCTDGVDKKEGKPLGFIPALLGSYFSEKNPAAPPDQITNMVKAQVTYDDDWFPGAILYVRTKRGQNEFEDRSDVDGFIQRSVYEAGCTTDEKGQRHGRRNMKSLEERPAGTAGGFNPTGVVTPKGLPKGAAPPRVGGPPPGAPPGGFAPPPSPPPYQQSAQPPQYAPQQYAQQPYAPPVQPQPQYAPQPQPQPQPQYQPQPQQVPPQQVQPQYAPQQQPQYAPPQYQPPPYQQPAQVAPQPQPQQPMQPALPQFAPPQHAPPGAPPAVPGALDEILRQAGVLPPG